MVRLVGRVSEDCSLRSPAKKASEKPLKEKIKEIAGTAEFLRSVPKHFARLEAADAGRRQVRLLLEGDKLAKVWRLTEDAEVKVHGWWGRLDQLQAGDRVWAWFKLDRRKQPVAVMMLADEPSQQDIHGAGVTLTARRGDRLTLKPAKGSDLSRTLPTTALREAADKLALQTKVYVQSAGGKVRLLFDAAGFEAARARQKEVLAQHWASEGLPGTVTFLHLSGESDFMLDHEAMRWGRSLKPGDKVFLQADPPIPAVVRDGPPWRERTQLRLVVHGLDQADLKLGQRLRLKMTPPSKEVLGDGAAAGRGPDKESRRTSGMVPGEHLLHLSGQGRPLYGHVLHAGELQPQRLWYAPRHASEPRP